MENKQLEILRLEIDKLSLKDGDVVIIRTKYPDYIKTPLLEFFDNIQFRFPVLCISEDEELFVLSPDGEEREDELCKSDG